MLIDKTKITREMLDKALECETAEELIALAKTEGYDITKDEAKAYLAEMANFELDSKELDKVAGGFADLCWTNYCKDNCPLHKIFR